MAMLLRLTICLILLTDLCIAGAPDLSYSQEKISPGSTPELAPTAITLQMDQALEFSDAEGHPVIVTPGTYRLLPTSSNQLQFISAETEETTVVCAQTFRHAEPLSAPATLLIQDEEAESHLHLLLFFPDGHGWDAEGRREQIQPRGIGDITKVPFTPTQQYTAVILQQGRVTTDDDWNEQEAVPPSKNSAPYLNTMRSFGRVTLARDRLPLDEKARQSLFRRCRYCVKKP